ncbi:nucleoid-associated protein [Pseudomonas fluorescens]|uniref:nucleoid-associated protein n=1 Tax=Pseudomonas fluorescens TaxID=294 RepID=UPI00177F01C1|nr:nucleoid-associated protein [Pseudomonas fluorescens]
MKRINNRARHGRRQQWIKLPPSGLRGIGDGREEDGSSQALGGLPREAERFGIETLSVEMAAGTRAGMAAAMKVHGYTQLQELLQNLHRLFLAASPEEQAHRLQQPDAPAFEISPKLARQFEQASRAELKRDPGDEKSLNLAEYARVCDKIGDPIRLDELSAVIEENNPKTFADFIKAGDYGLAESFAPDKRPLNQYRRYTGRVEGMSISFEAHLLGKRVEFDQDSASLTIKNLPMQLIDQLKRATAV